MKSVHALSVVVLSTIWSNHAPGQFDALPDSDATWIHHAFDPWTIDYYGAYCLDPLSHDTLINDTTYSILLYCDPWTGFPSTLCGGLYDNGLGQVYFYRPDSARSFLLYDFDVLPGDTVSVIVDGIFMRQLYVATVDTISIADKQCKRIGIQSEAAILGGQGVVHWWVQGVGGTNGLLETSGNLTLDVTSGLECMSYDDTIWWSWGPNGGPGSCMNVGIEDAQQGNSSWFHPTLVSDAIHLDVPMRPHAQVQVHGLDGRLMSRYATDQNLISFDGLLPGAYLLRCTDEHDRALVGRFVKF